MTQNDKHFGIKLIENDNLWIWDKNNPISPINLSELLFEKIGVNRIKKKNKLLGIT